MNPVYSRNNPSEEVRIVSKKAEIYPRAVNPIFSEFLSTAFFTDLLVPTLSRAFLTHYWIKLKIHYFKERG